MPKGFYKRVLPIHIAELQRRKTHCKNGHEYTEENTVRWPSQPYSRHCKICLREKSTMRWKTQGKAKRRFIHLKYKYGISLEDFNKIFKEQNGICAICNVSKATHIDHNHKTSKVRGLLCRDCNIGLGLFKDNKTFLLSAKTYLERCEG